jgi:putative Mn2+ efflux pump MntP
VGVVSVVATFLGLRFGALLGKRAEDAAGLWAGIILALTGLGFAAEKYFSH